MAFPGSVGSCFGVGFCGSLSSRALFRTFSGFQARAHFVFCFFWPLGLLGAFSGTSLAFWASSGPRASSRPLGLLGLFCRAFFVRSSRFPSARPGVLLNWLGTRFLAGDLQPSGLEFSLIGLGEGFQLGICNRANLAFPFLCSITYSPKPTGLMGMVWGCFSFCRPSGLTLVR